MSSQNGGSKLLYINWKTATFQTSCHSVLCPVVSRLVQEGLQDSESAFSTLHACPQLAAVSLLTEWSSATHTRWEHSTGVSELAGGYLDLLLKEHGLAELGFDNHRDVERWKTMLQVAGDQHAHGQSKAPYINSPWLQHEHGIRCMHDMSSSQWSNFSPCFSTTNTQSTTKST